MRIRTATISVEEYLADPAKARRLADRAGRAEIKDADGVVRLVIISERATEALP